MRVLTFPVLFLILIGSFTAATQYVAGPLGFPSDGRLVVIDGYPVYWPYMIFFWANAAQFALERNDELFREAVRVLLAGAVLSAVWILFFLGGFLRSTPLRNMHTYGSGRWATLRDLRKAGLLTHNGVILAQTYNARYKQDRKGQYHCTKIGRFITHDGPEHCLLVAPTRSGKGVGVVVPSLLHWPHSVIVYDIKKENWQLTSGWRRTMSHTLRFEPTAPFSVRYNPFTEIRKGTEHEIKDVQNLAELIVDPNGSKENRDYWERSGRSLLSGAILHVLYTSKNPCFSDLVVLLANPASPIAMTLQMMKEWPHDPVTCRPHPQIASYAQELLNKAPQELSGVVSTAMSFLELFRDPLIAKNTSASDFRITDLRDSQYPVSLYLVVPPNDIARTRPLIRIVLSQFMAVLADALPSSKAHRILFLIDEFPTLGALHSFSTAMAYLAGYKIKCFLVAQSFNQLSQTYGEKNSIVDNCHIRLVYAAGDEQSAERISKQLGTTTELRESISRSGGRFDLVLTQINKNYTETRRELMTPGEVMQMDYTEALLMVTGHPPYRAKKNMYYIDPRFIDSKTGKPRYGQPPPEHPVAQNRELCGLASHVARRPVLNTAPPPVSSSDAFASPVPTSSPPVTSGTFPPSVVSSRPTGLIPNDEQAANDAIGLHAINPDVVTAVAVVSPPPAPLAAPRGNPLFVTPDEEGLN